MTLQFPIIIDINRRLYKTTTKYTFFIPTSNKKHSCCFTFLPTFGVLSVSDFSCSNKYSVVSYCYFNLQFPNDIRCWMFFHIHICHLYIFGEEYVKNVLPILIGLFFYCWVRSVLCIFVCSFFIRYMFCQDSFQVCDLSFHSL